NRAPSRAPVRLAPGAHGVSNALLDTPWPKLTAARERIEHLLRDAPRGSAELREALFEILSDDERAEDALLPDTGVGLEKERVLSAAFIDTPDYGTRSSTVVLFHADGRLELEERTHEAGRRDATARVFTFMTRRS